MAPLLPLRGKSSPAAREIRNPKSEIRNPKEISKSKHQIQNKTSRLDVFSCFLLVIGISFGFRISDFGFRISRAAGEDFDSKRPCCRDLVHAFACLDERSAIADVLPQKRQYRRHQLDRAIDLRTAAAHIGPDANEILGLGMYGLDFA